MFVPLKESWINYTSYNYKTALVNSTEYVIMDNESATVSRHALKNVQRN